MDILAYLGSNPYPGRGLIVGNDRIYYFLMGRSEQSRNRVLVAAEDGIRTAPYDAAAIRDPSLIIYRAAARMGTSLVVTNGDQTDTILSAGDFRKGLRRREYEPDAPHYTPRISAILEEDGTFELSIIRHVDGTCERAFWRYEEWPTGAGAFLSTYEGDGDPLPSFSGEPYGIELPEPEDVWAALNPANRVAMYAYVNGRETIFSRYGSVK